MCGCIYSESISEYIGVECRVPINADVEMCGAAVLHSLHDFAAICNQIQQLQGIPLIYIDIHCNVRDISSGQICL